MPKPTREHKARAKKRIQLMIHDWFISPAALDESPEVKNEIYKELLRLEKEEQKLLDPQPRKPSKPKAMDTTEPESMPTVKIERWGRDGRNG